VEFRLKR